MNSVYWYWKTHCWLVERFLQDTHESDYVSMSTLNVWSALKAAVLLIGFGHIIIYIL